MLETENELESLGEFEDEFESELEDESEGEEEYESEWESELEGEGEDEYEGEYEDEEPTPVGRLLAALPLIVRVAAVLLILTFVGLDGFKDAGVLDASEIIKDFCFLTQRRMRGDRFARQRNRSGGAQMFGKNESQ